MIKIEFLNKESNKTITLPLDKKMIFIYGKNGSGKTTLSRSLKDNNCYVFNEDFIYKNVYVIQNDGAKVDQTTKNNFSELLIGEEEVTIKKEIVKFEEFNRKLSLELKDKNTLVTNVLFKNGLSQDDNILTTMIDDNFEYSFESTPEEQLNNYGYTSKLEQKIKNDEELQLKIKQLNKQENLVDLNNKINNNPLLNAYLYSNNEIVNTLNQEILIIKSYDKIITDLEKLAKEKNVDSKHFETIKKCLDIQKETGIDKCFLCGTENVLSNIEEWNKIISDKTVSERDNLKKKLKQSIDSANMILESKKIYELVAPKTIKYIELYIDSIKAIISSIDNKKYELLKIGSIELDSKIVETKEIKESIRNYLLKSFEKDVVFYNSLINLVTKTIKSNKENLDKILTKNSNENEKSINTILTELGLNKEMTITVDRYGGNPKYRIDLKNGNINSLSDGQKHKLALAVFLNYIKNKKLDKDSIVLFDDPVVSLDESGYHLFKKYIISNIMKPEIEDSPTLIILTHNFNYLYVQISNVISKENLRDNSIVYKISSSGIQVLDFHYFELDDIALFKECLEKMKYQFQLNDLSIIYLKLFRVFLDLSLRIKGVPDTLEIHEEIVKLKLDSKFEDRLRDIHRKLCGISKKRNNNIDKSKEGLFLLKEATDILGYSYITDKDIKQSETLVEIEPFYENDVFFILNEIISILLDQKDKNYSNYLNHPRISFTQNILATSMNQ